MFNVDIQKSVLLLLDTYPIVPKIVNDIIKLGGRCYLVGGAVRDLVMGVDVKDLDIEIHDVSSDTVERVLQIYGQVSLVGKAFGVFRLHGYSIDWSLPRMDKAGRKPDVVIDPYMPIEQALRRRDLTMNAMAIDLGDYCLIDPFAGMKDIELKVLRTPDPEFFLEDPLRFYRVMQFISRFEMEPDSQLNRICKNMDLHSVSIERIEQEFRKMMLKSKLPSLGLRWIQSIGRLKQLFPELSELVGLAQWQRFHPEGDVFEHTMQTVDAAAHLSYSTNDEKWIVMLAALCHDLGKAQTTKKVKGVWRSFGHSQAGEKIAKKLLKRITKNKDVIDAVVKMVRYHMAPVQFIEDGAKGPAYKRLANKLKPNVTLDMLAKLALSDQQGRNKNLYKPCDVKDERVEEFLKRAQEAHVLHTQEKPILQGRDLLGVVQSGPNMGRLLRDAYEVQIEEGISDKEELKRRILSKK